MGFDMITRLKNLTPIQRICLVVWSPLLVLVALLLLIPVSLIYAFQPIGDFLFNPSEDHDD